MPGTLTLMGSGEMTELMGKVHRKVMSRVGGQVVPAFLDTPAGFQLNSDELAERAVQYFRQRFDLALQVASHRGSAQTTEATLSRTLDTLGRANFLFAGPGSPSYAARQWANGPVGEAICRRFAQGAQLVFASAAAIALSRHAVPVYELYKVGESPHWIDGLDLLGAYGFELAIITHWNNQEGGTHDTRFAYLGQPRLEALESALPEQAVILGVDEYTACIIDITAGQCEVWGKGAVTVRHRGREVVTRTGWRFPIAQLTAAWFSGVTDATSRTEASPTGEGLGSVIPQTAPVPPAVDEEQQIDATVKLLVESLVALREELRTRDLWSLADRVRGSLLEAGIALQDRPEGTRWSAVRRTSRS